MKLDKIKRYYLNHLSCMNFGVKKITNKQTVYSIKLKKITTFMMGELDKICKIIEGAGN